MIAFARRYFWSALFGAWAITFEWMLVDNIWTGHDLEAAVAGIGMVWGFGAMIVEALRAE